VVDGGYHPGQQGRIAVANRADHITQAYALGDCGHGPATGRNDP
jgi:hypothetical protein